MTDRAADSVEVELFIHHQTLGDKGALKVSLDGDEAAHVWLPKSQVQIDTDRAGAVARGQQLVNVRAVITMPAWLAEEKGLEGGVRAEGIDDLFGGVR